MFRGTILRNVPWVASVIPAITVPTPPPPLRDHATQATRNILYLGQEFWQIK